MILALIYNLQIGIMILLIYKFIMKDDNDAYKAPSVFS